MKLHLYNVGTDGFYFLWLRRSVDYNISSALHVDTTNIAQMRRLIHSRSGYVKAKINNLLEDQII